MSSVIEKGGGGLVSSLLVLVVLILLGQEERVECVPMPVVGVDALGITIDIPEKPAMTNKNKTKKSNTTKKPTRATTMSPSNVVMLTTFSGKIQGRGFGRRNRTEDETTTMGTISTPTPSAILETTTTKATTTTTRPPNKPPGVTTKGTTKKPATTTTKKPTKATTPPPAPKGRSISKGKKTTTKPTTTSVPKGRSISNKKTTAPTTKKPTTKPTTTTKRPIPPISTAKVTTPSPGLGDNPPTMITSAPPAVQATTVANAKPQGRGFGKRRKPPVEVTTSSPPRAGNQITSIPSRRSPTGTTSATGQPKGQRKTSPKPSVIARSPPSALPTIEEPVTIPIKKSEPSTFLTGTTTTDRSGWVYEFITSTEPSSGLPLSSVPTTQSSQIHEKPAVSGTPSGTTRPPNKKKTKPKNKTNDKMTNDVTSHNSSSVNVSNHQNIINNVTIYNNTVIYDTWEAVPNPYANHGPVPQQNNNKSIVGITSPQQPGDAFSGNPAPNTENPKTGPQQGVITGKNKFSRIRLRDGTELVSSEIINMAPPAPDSISGKKPPSGSGGTGTPSTGVKRDKDKKKPDKKDGKDSHRPVEKKDDKDEDPDLTFDDENNDNNDKDDLRKDKPANSDDGSKNKNGNGGLNYHHKGTVDRFGKFKMASEEKLSVDSDMASKFSGLDDIKAKFTRRKPPQPQQQSGSRSSTPDDEEDEESPPQDKDNSPDQDQDPPSDDDTKANDDNNNDDDDNNDDNSIANPYASSPQKKKPNAIPSFPSNFMGGSKTKAEVQTFPKGGVASKGETSSSNSKVDDVGDVVWE